VKVFIQNEAGSNRKNCHDEKTLEYRETRIVSRPYPYPYGFILGTNANDGCNLDVFVITKRSLTTGSILECEAIGLMEQFEDGSMTIMYWPSCRRRTSRSRTTFRRFLRISF